MADVLPKPRYYDDDVWGSDTWPLLSHAYTGDLGGARSLLAQDADLIRSQFAYYEPLHYAVRGGHADMVELLLESGANPRAEGWANRMGEDTPLDKALDRERSDLAELLRKAPVKRKRRTETEETWTRTPEQLLVYELELACGRADRKRADAILAEHPEFVNNGFYEAVHHGHLELAVHLLEAGADVKGHMPWACWFTPLMHALRYPQARFELAELLLDNGADATWPNGLGMSTLHIVVLSGTPEAARWLVNRQGDIDFVDSEFCSTPLGWAARWGRPEMAELLLAAGADAEAPADQPWAQPHRWAEKKGHREIAKMLG